MTITTEGAPAPASTDTRPKTAPTRAPRTRRRTPATPPERRPEPAQPALFLEPPEPDEDEDEDQQEAEHELDVPAPTQVHVRKARRRVDGGPFGDLHPDTETVGVMRRHGRKYGQCVHPQDGVEVSRFAPADVASIEAIRTRWGAGTYYLMAYDHRGRMVGRSTTIGVTSLTSAAPAPAATQDPTLALELAKLELERENMKRRDELDREMRERREALDLEASARRERDFERMLALARPAERADASGITNEELERRLREERERAEMQAEIARLKERLDEPDDDDDDDDKPNVKAAEGALGSAERLMGHVVRLSENPVLGPVVSSVLAMALARLAAPAPPPPAPPRIVPPAVVQQQRAAQAQAAQQQRAKATQKGRRR